MNLIPANLTEEFKPHLSKGFDVAIVEEGDTLSVIITQSKYAKTIVGIN